MKYPNVTIYNSAEGYILDVAVYRSVTTPNEISVHIQGIHPIPPQEPKINPDPVRQLVRPGVKAIFKATLYPPKKKE